MADWIGYAGSRIGLDWIQPIFQSGLYLPICVAHWCHRLTRSVEESFHVVPSAHVSRRWRAVLPWLPQCGVMHGQLGGSNNPTAQSVWKPRTRGELPGLCVCAYMQWCVYLTGCRVGPYNTHDLERMHMMMSHFLHWGFLGDMSGNPTQKHGGQ